ncbi:hypothetical protein [Aliivibrio sp. S10_S31]|uniref:hypothetical protein n=1 Tax=Aliivibrio sp. S10_S31 TaxID=2720224 RepID=UPI0016809918|nr:hypothetical protein [Aliivibrio sp. S10_S31]MBD1569737.1 hypothetical protein [Aliivibrio sp. S10_S31]
MKLTSQGFKGPKLPISLDNNGLLFNKPKAVVVVSKEIINHIYCDLKSILGDEFAITGSCALFLHALSVKVDFSRNLNDMDFLVKNFLQVERKLILSNKFNYTASSFSQEYGSGWIQHKETGCIVDILEDNGKFGTLEASSIIDNKRVCSLLSLYNSLEIALANEWLIEGKKKRANDIKLLKKIESYENRNFSILKISEILKSNKNQL